jgi:hypothetical protein
MDQLEVVSALYWIGWLELIKRIGGIMVIAGVAIEVGGDWLGGPFHKTVEDARELQLSSLNNEAARLKSDNLETEKIIQPREFPIYGRNNDAAQLMKELKTFAGTKVWVQSVPDFEASRLTVSLNGLFDAVGWNVSTVGPAETGVGPLAIMEGVTVLFRYSHDTFPPPENASPDRLQSAAEVLVKRLQMDSALGSNFFSIHWEFLTIPPPKGGVQVTMPPPRAKVPNDTMLVLVGLKPIGALISEKNAKAPPQQPNK